MTVVWTITKFLLYVFVLIVLFRQSFNLIFIIGRRPKIWISSVGLLGFFNMALAYAMGWGGGEVSSAAIFAFILNMRPSLPNGITKSQMRSMSKEFYNELGLPYGRSQESIGLAAFGLLSVAGYVLFFVEACGSGGINGSCTPLIRTLI